MKPADQQATQQAASSGGSWAAVLAGVVGFIVGGGLCLATCYGLLGLYASTLPRRSEAYEGFGDVLLLFGGAAFSVLASIVVGLVSGMWASDRVGRS